MFFFKAITYIMFFFIFLTLFLFIFSLFLRVVKLLLSSWRKLFSRSGSDPAPVKGKISLEKE